MLNQNRKEIVMQLRQITKFSALTLLASFHIGLTAQNWETVLDFQYMQEAGGIWGATADSLGNVFLGGSGTDFLGNFHGLVVQTDSTAAEWSLVGDLQPPAPYRTADARGLSLDTAGNLYWSGTFAGAPCAKSSCPGPVWFVRKSPDFGQSWMDVDTFVYAPGQLSDARGVASHPSGRTFVAGSANDSHGKSHWIVRASDSGAAGTWSNADDVPGAAGRGIKYIPNRGLFAVGFTEQTKTLSNGWLVRRSADGGVSWSTVDLHQLPKQSGWYQDAAALGLVGDAEGNIYVAGSIKAMVTVGRTASAPAQWLIRHSTDGGTTWQTLNMFAYVPGKEASAWGISSDAAGRVVAIGRGQDSQGIFHWIVRRRDAQGFWQTVDDYQLATGKNAYAQAVVVDAAGNLLVSGEVVDANGGYHWIVRRLSNPAI